MKFLIPILFLFFPLNANKENNTILVLQINSKWNQNHTIDLNGLSGCRYVFGFLENQPDHIKKQISTVPVILIYKDNQISYQWVADLSFKLDIDVKQVQEVVNKL